MAAQDISKILSQLRDYPNQHDSRTKLQDLVHSNYGRRA